MQTKKFLKKNNNITKKNKQSGGLMNPMEAYLKASMAANSLRPSFRKKMREIKKRAAKEVKEKNKEENPNDKSYTNTSSKKQRWPSMKIPKISNPFGPSVAAQGAAVLHKEQLKKDKKEKHKANIELVMKAKKGLDKYKEKGDFLYKLSEKANEDDESHQFIKNNLYYLTLGILETAYDAYKYESKEGEEDEDKVNIKKNINDLTKINNYTNEFENHPKIEKKVIFDQLDLIKMLNNKQKATLKANLFILSLSDLKFKGKDKYGDGDNKSILNINPAKKNEEQNGGEIQIDGLEEEKEKFIPKQKLTRQDGSRNLLARPEEPKEEADTEPNQPLLKQNASRNLLQDADRKLITRPEELTQYIEGKGNEAFTTGRRPGDNRLDSEQNIFLKKILLQQ